MPDRILIVDDDPVQRRLLEAAVTRMGHVATVVDGGQKAVEALTRPGAGFGLVILDLVMPDMDGLGVLAAMRDKGIAIPVVVQTAQGGIETAIAAMRAGAFDFVVKPASPERLAAAVAGALRVEAIGNQVRRSGASKTTRAGFADVVTRSGAMQSVMRLAHKAATSTIPILVEGESGTGKELVAKAIQASGDRRDKPFVTVNCGAIPDNLVESILFGHEKGAFTGATERHSGKFVEADGGTLFLDEIGDLPLDVQVKLLRAVQEGEIETVGSRGTRKVDIRLISATHRDLGQRVAQGLFREDLYYRLSVLPIQLPPLRERKEDIPDLVHRFLDRFSKQEGTRARSIAHGALAMLSAYDWPGNIRQLENAVFRAVVLAEGETLEADDFPQIRAQVEGIDIASLLPTETTGPMRVEDDPAGDATSEPVAGSTLRVLDSAGNVRSLAEVEFEMIRLALDHYGGQMSEVARRLGIGRSTLYRKLKEYGLEPEETRATSIAS